MPSLQYAIDSLCSSVTVECVYSIVDALVSQGHCSMSDIIPLVQAKDRSLDAGSAELIARAALKDMAHRGTIRIEAESVYPAN